MGGETIFVTEQRFRIDNTANVAALTAAGQSTAGPHRNPGSLRWPRSG